MKKTKFTVWDVLLWKSAEIFNNFENAGADDMDIIGIYDNLEDALYLYENASEDCQRRIMITEGIINLKTGDFHDKVSFCPYYEFEELQQAELNTSITTKGEMI
jgi:hypothetical protein